MDNRSHILECALELFSERGYEATGVQEVVEAAGVTKPSLYHYFNSKRGLLDALLEQEFAGLTAKLTGAALYAGDLVLTLEKVVQVYFGFAREHRRFYRMRLTMQFAPPESEPNQAVTRFSMAHFHCVEELFAQAAADHGNLRGRQRAYAATFIGMIDTYIGMFLNGYIELDDPLVYQAVHQFMHGIFA